MKATILVVDAHEGIRGTLDRVISAMGHEVIHTGSIHEAESKLPEVQAAIVGICTDDGFPDQFVRSLGDLPYARITEAFADYIPDDCVGCGAYEKGNMELGDIHRMVDMLVGRAMRIQAGPRTQEQSP